MAETTTYQEAGKAKSPKKDSDALLKLAHERFERAEEAFSDTRKLQRDDYRFALGSPDNNWQWRDEDYRTRVDVQKRPALTINKLPLHISQVTNDARQNRPAIKIRPVDDKADPETADIFNGVIRHIEANSDADIATDMAVDHTAKHGEGYMRVVTEYADEDSFDQEIFIKPVADPFAVYCSPDAIDPTASDSEWWLVEAWYGKEEFKRKWPSAEPLNAKAIETHVRSWIEKDKIRVVEHWRYEVKKYDLFLWADGSITAGREGRVAVEEPVRTRKVEAKVIKCDVLNAAQILETNDWAGKCFPFVRVVGNWDLIEGKIVQSGIVRNAKDAQRMYNFWVSQEAEFLGKQNKFPYLAPAEAIEGYENDWANSNRSDQAVLKWKHVDDAGQPIPAPVRVQPLVAPSGLINAKMGASEDIKATTGQFDASLGQRSNETSGRAILARQREGDTATYHYVDNLAKSIRHLGRILVDLIPKIYDARTVARVLGEDGEAKIVKLNPDQPQSKVEQEDEAGEIQTIYNLGVGKYDVVSTVGPSFTTKRQESVEAMTTLLQGNPQLWQVMGDLAVKNMDWPGADDIAKRLKAMIPPQILGASEGDEPIPPQVQAQLSQMEQVMQQAAQMIQNLQGENQQLKQGALQKLAEIERKGDVDVYMKLLDVAKEVLLNTGKPMDMDTLAVIMSRLDSIAETLAPGAADGRAPSGGMNVPDGGGLYPACHTPGCSGPQECGMGEGEMPDPSQQMMEDPAMQGGDPMNPVFDPGAPQPDPAALDDPSVSGQFGGQEEPVG